MRRPKNDANPLHADVRRGLGGTSAGRFVFDRETTAVDLNALLIDGSSNNFLLQTEDGARILLS